MKLKTSFWTKTIHEFNNLQLIKHNQSPYHTAHTVVDSISLQNELDVALFFRRLAKKIMSFDINDTFQFAVIDFDLKLIPIKWFTLEIGSIEISHDIAFETTLIKKNGVDIPLGRFPFRNKKYPLRREMNIKRNAYKYISNQIMKHLT